MSTDKVAQDVAQTPAMRHNTPRTGAATYPADCLGKTFVVHRDCAAALETELTAMQVRAEKAEAEVTKLRDEFLGAHGEIEQQAKLLWRSYSREALLIARAAMKEASK